MPPSSLPPQQVVSFLEIPAFVLLGLVSALAAIALLRSIALVEASHDRLGTPRWLRPALAGRATGLLALQLPEVLGVGYEATDLALRNSYELQFAILLALAKAAATALCLGSGFGGGMFSPSLVLGAMVGSAFGIVAAQRAAGARLGGERLRAARHGRGRRLHARRADLDRDHDLRADRATTA